MTRTDYAEVFKAKGNWNIRFTSEPMRSEVIDLFGTDTLPTPYTEALDYTEVFNRLRSVPANANVCFVEAVRWA